LFAKLFEPAEKLSNKTISSAISQRDSARCVKRPFKVTQGHMLLC